MTNYRDVLTQALEALESLFSGQADHERAKRCSDAITAIRAALAEQPAEQQEPATDLKAQHRHEWFRTGAMEPGQMRCITCGIWGLEVPQPAKRVPLTDEEIDQMWSDAHNDTSAISLVKVFARAIEAAHGIKGETK